MMKTFTPESAYSNRLVCGHLEEAAHRIEDLGRIVCTECHPFVVAQCTNCFGWFTNPALQKTGPGKRECEECRGLLTTREKDDFEKALLVAGFIAMFIFAVLFWRTAQL